MTDSAGSIRRRSPASTLIPKSMMDFIALKAQAWFSKQNQTGAEITEVGNRIE
jgi:hypothetical protein